MEKLYQLCFKRHARPARHPSARDRESKSNLLTAERTVPNPQLYGELQQDNHRRTELAKGRIAYVLD